MMAGERSKPGLIESILELELAMFLSVPTAQKYTCQEHPDAFRLHRRAQFSAWSADTLASYLRDLETAISDGENLMTSKYARMDNLIPRLNANPLIDEIASHQCTWQREMFRKYPCLMRGGRPLSSTEDSAFLTSFETYLRCELETYSDATLSLLHSDIMVRAAQGLSMTEQIYMTLVQERGYNSLEDAEETARNSTSHSR